MQCDAVWCSVLQCVAVCRSVLQCVAVCCSVLQCIAVTFNVSSSDARKTHSKTLHHDRCRHAMQYDAVCCSVLECDAVFCSMMQCDAECRDMRRSTHWNSASESMHDFQKKKLALIISLCNASATVASSIYRKRVVLPSWLLQSGRPLYMMSCVARSRGSRALKEPLMMIAFIITLAERM